MIDPFPGPPVAVVRLVKPFADALHLYTLPLHIHEIIFAALFYTSISHVISPFLSARMAPNIYPRMSRRSKLNWDVHIVSFVQSIIINGLSLWVIWCDEERKVWRSNLEGVWQQRTWGYLGSSGLCQSFALGYFMWDLVMCTRHTEVFGVGMLAHALSAVAVFGLGYWPFIYFSAPIFLLYELSSPFLNIHWFCDKLNMTGTTFQAVNGLCLVFTFFGCRLVWGLWNSWIVFEGQMSLHSRGHNNYVLRHPGDKTYPPYTVDQLMALRYDKTAQLHAFNRDQWVPLWIPLIYLLANCTLNSLNIFWFGKMIETIRTRFDPPWGTKGVGPDKVEWQPKLEEDSEDSDLGIGQPGRVHEHRRDSIPGGALPKTASGAAQDTAPPEATAGAKAVKGSVRAARKRAEEKMNGPIGTVQDTRIEDSGNLVDSDVGSGAEATGTQRRSGRRRKA